MATTDTSPPLTTSTPWWRHGYVWLVISGPAIVVVAGFITLWLAIRTPDPVVDENYYQAGSTSTKRWRNGSELWHPPCRGATIR